MANDSISQEDVINILLATDIHLGYAEKDPVRGEDSFNAFEEILETGQRLNVDFVLLGGDLFHDAKPSPVCLHRCISLLRNYCLGDKPVKLEFLSDQSLNFSHYENPIVNYEDPNLNIALPIFSIHGNHDDPIGLEQISTLDTLSTMGLVNYFGKITNFASIDLYPILLKKGATKLALYGLSHVKDKRLCHLFNEEKVTLSRPAGENEWFSLLTLHQNRCKRAKQSYIPESVLPDFLNFVLWGHEHDCRVDTEISAANEVPITQPGSSVATSLSIEESGEKYIALLSVHKTNFKFEKIKLKTVRPFIFKNLNLDDFEPDTDSKKTISEQAVAFVQEEIDRAIIEAKELITGHPKQPTLPLIRVRVDYMNENQQFNAVRTSQAYHDKVANPNDVILLRKSNLYGTNKKIKDEIDVGAMENQVIQSCVETKVEEYFNEVEEKKKTQVLSVAGMCQAVTACISKNDYEAIDLIFKHGIEKSMELIKDRISQIKCIDNEISSLNTIRSERKEEISEIDNLLNDPDRERKPPPFPDDETVPVGGDSDEEVVPVRPTRGRGSRGGRGASTRGSKRGRGRGANVIVVADDPLEDYEPVVTSPTTRSGRRGRPSLKLRQVDAPSPAVTHNSPRRAAALGKSYIILSDSD